MPDAQRMDERVVAYDTQYAMVDRDDDLCIGVESTASLFGRWDNSLIALLHLASLAILALIGWRRGLSWHFDLGLALALLCAGWQQYLCRERERDLCLSAFRNNNWYGAAVFCGFALALAASG